MYYPLISAYNSKFYRKAFHKPALVLRTKKIGGHVPADFRNLFRTTYSVMAPSF